MAKTATVRDDFTRGLAPGWSVVDGDATAGAGKLSMPVEVGAPVEVDWAAPLDLTDSHIYVKPGPVLDEATHYRMLLTGADGHAGFVVVGPNPGALRFRLKQDLVPALADTFVDYDPLVHVWWRLREAAGFLYWDTAPDGQAWTNQRVAAHSIDLAAVTLSFQVGADDIGTGFGEGLFGIGGFGGASALLDDTFVLDESLLD